VAQKERNLYDPGVLHDEAELEDNARWRRRRGISTTLAYFTTVEYLMAPTRILSYVLRCS
jgi:hypothetical protein